MVLRKEIVELSDGTKIEIREISFAGQLRLADLKENNKFSLLDLYRECLSEDSFKLLDLITKEDGNKIQEGVRKVNQVGDATKKE
jgi:hypothetical protein